MKWRTYHTQDITERYLFKFLPCSRSLEFLQNGTIWFSRADQFGDKMECVRISDLTKIPLDYTEIEERKRRFLISCWHLANKETLAFWDTYSDSLENRKNIAIRFDRTYLTNAIEDSIHRNDLLYYQTKWIHGTVQYKNLINQKSERLNKNTIKFPAFRKEGAFFYENEYRFVIEQVSQNKSKGFNYHIGEPKNMEFDILINPLLKKDQFLLCKQKIIDAGFKNKIKDSVLTKWLQPEKW